MSQRLSHVAAQQIGAFFFLVCVAIFLRNSIRNMRCIVPNMRCCLRAIEWSRKKAGAYSTSRSQVQAPQVFHWIFCPGLPSFRLLIIVSLSPAREALLQDGCTFSLVWEGRGVVMRFWKRFVRVRAEHRNN